MFFRTIQSTQHGSCANEPPRLVSTVFPKKTGKILSSIRFSFKNPWSSLFILNSTFLENHSKFQSNCLYFMGNLLSIESSLFANSSGIYDHQDFSMFPHKYMPYWHGENAGAILTFAKNLTVKNCYFSNNSNLNGGAIFLNRHANSGLQYLRIERTIFARNQAGESGSSIYLGQDVQYILGIVAECFFLENYSFNGIFHVFFIFFSIRKFLGKSRNLPYGAVQP